MFRFTEKIANLEIDGSHYAYFRIAEENEQFDIALDFGEQPIADIKIVRFTRQNAYLVIGENRYVYKRVRDNAQATGGDEQIQEAAGGDEQELEGAAGGDEQEIQGAAGGDEPAHNADGDELWSRNFDNADAAIEPNLGAVENNGKQFVKVTEIACVTFVLALTAKELKFSNVLTSVLFS